MVVAAIHSQSMNKGLCRQGHFIPRAIGSGVGRIQFVVIGVAVLMCQFISDGWSPAAANHQGHRQHADTEHSRPTGPGHSVPGTSFQVFAGVGNPSTSHAEPDRSRMEPAVQTVVEAFSIMLQHRSDYPRFDESIKKELLARVVIEPHVVNDEGKEFPFLVARTKEPGRVILLINGASLEENGQVGHPDKLVPLLAREFQWVVSKADSSPKATPISVDRHLREAPVRPDQEILSLSPDDRAEILRALFHSYLRTVDDQKSLDGQSYFEMGTTNLVPPSQHDSTTKLYDIRVREALQRIVSDPAFAEKTPQAVRSLLNGKVWNVAFVKIDQRDWATRTRVLPEEKSVLVGARNQRIQPASVLVNTYRTASPDDPFYAQTKGLPMGALSAEQLAWVIAFEVQQNIHEKSTGGHVAQDALSAPR